MIFKKKYFYYSIFSSLIKSQGFLQKHVSEKPQLFALPKCFPLQGLEVTNHSQFISYGFF